MQSITFQVQIEDYLVPLVQSSSEEDTKRISDYVNFFFKTKQRQSRTELLQVMSEMAAEAKENGLTEEILNEILAEND